MTGTSQRASQRFFRDPLFDAQFSRVVGLTYYGAADLRECLAVADRIPNGDVAGWYDAWTALAERVEAGAQASFVAGHLVSAREAFFRAFNYHRAAYAFLLAAPLDPRAVTAHDRQSEAFDRGMALMDTPGEVLAIPFEGVDLRALFFRPDTTGEVRPTLIILNGYDGTAEEMFFYAGPAALKRGYNVLVFDGPGQGRALLKDGLRMRPDWESVIAPVMTTLLGRPEVDPERIVLMGLSLGGYLAARAASGEPRLAALVCDPGQYSILDEAKSRLPHWMARALPDGNRLVLGLLGRILERQARKPTGGWALRRGMLVHGRDTPLAYVQDTAAYTLEGRAADIACPTMVCTAEADGIGLTARPLFDALTCEKRFHIFKAADGAGSHCEGGARSLANREIFDWLGTVLARI